MKKSLLSILFFLILNSFLYSKSLYWERIDVDVNVLEDGSLDMTEIQEYVFDGDWNGGMRNLRINDCDNIKFLGIEETTGNEIILYTEGNISKLYCYQITKKLGQLEIKWRCRRTSDPPFQNTHKTFKLHYLVIGAIRPHKDFDEIYWKTVFEDRQDIVKNATTTVRFPERVSIEPDKFGVIFYCESLKARWEIQENNTIIFSALNVQPKELFEVRITFPKGICKYNYTVASFAKRRITPILPVVLPPLSLLITLIIMIYLFTRYGKDYEIYGSSAYSREPPSDLSPAIAGGLIDEKVNTKEITATLFDLARKEIIEIEEVEEGKWLWKKKDFIFTLKKSSSEVKLESYEVKILTELFSNTKIVGWKRNLSELKNQFYTAIPKIKDNIFNEMVSRKFFEKDPRKVIKKYTGLAFLLIIPGIILIAISNFIAAFLFVWGAGFGSAGVVGLAGIIREKKISVDKLIMMLCFGIPGLIAILIGVGMAVLSCYGLGNWKTLLPAHLKFISVGLSLSLIFSGVIIAIFAPFMPRKTYLGSREKELWIGFKKYLSDLDKFDMLNKAEEYFANFLPYAIAFGVEKKWIERFEGLNIKPPSYYHSSFVSSSGTSSSLSTSGISIASLSGSISAAVSTMASTLSSAPSSSGSSSGGGSGGGGGGGGW